MRVKKPKAPKVKRNILCVGDSLTAGGQWIDEAYRRLAGVGGDPLALGFPKVNFIGSRKTGEARHEGYGGWRWDSITANAMYRNMVSFLRE